ncbi:FAD-binding domain-containing protein [Ascobolus immersus RN42]|uniref:FAD-binding domain-containing protein n=1 Tax=Ascobolus immersus RN42 TaxID=1160509 RepID=A0A3N4HJJ3_ASCIM|nr:FAD-binding domain-containing protein [Ascobolus immersus RN42]
MKFLTTALLFLIPTSPTYATLSRPFNLRLPWKPSVIVYPKNYDQTSRTVKCGNSANVKMSVRGGGHSYGAFGLGGENGRLVIDVERFQSVVYNSSNQRAQVGAGLRLGNMAAKLASYGRALPHGTCAGVGLAGHALHGGFGYTSRNWGLTVDNIIELKGIKADGSTFIANESTNPDLFWALRGAGSSFAIVLEFKLKTYPAPASTVNFSYGIEMGAINADKATQLYLAWQEFGKTAPKELGIQMYVEPWWMSIGGNYYGSRADFDRIIKPLVDKTTAIYGRAPLTTVSSLGWLATLESLSGGPIARPTSGFSEFDTFYAKSLVVPTADALKQVAVRSLFDYIFTNRDKEPSGYYFIANLYGGPGSLINAVSSTATAYFDRDAFIVFQFYGFAANNSPPFNAQTIPFINNLSKAITDKQARVGGGVWPAYANYIDPELTYQEAGQKYFGGNLARLRQLKTVWDPQNRLGGGIGV